MELNDIQNLQLELLLDRGASPLIRQPMHITSDFHSTSSRILICNNYFIGSFNFNEHIPDAPVPFLATADGRTTRMLEQYVSLHSMVSGEDLYNEISKYEKNEPGKVDCYLDPFINIPSCCVPDPSRDGFYFICSKESNEVYEFNSILKKSKKIAGKSNFKGSFLKYGQSEGKTKAEQQNELIGQTAAEVPLDQPIWLSLSNSQDLLAISDVFNFRVLIMSTKSLQIVKCQFLGNMPSSVEFFDSPTQLYIATYSTILLCDVSSPEIQCQRICGSTGSIMDGGFLDGPKFEARFRGITGMLMHPNHEYLYIADSANSRIRILDFLTGHVSTFAGNGGKYISPGPITQAAIFRPYGLAWNANGDMIIGSHEGDAILRIKRVLESMDFDNHLNLSTLPRRIWI